MTSEQDLREKASVDGLTGALNRKAAEQKINTLMQDKECKGYLLMLDIDDFKTVNDTMGHAIGDLALITLVKLLKEHFRREDIIGRLGGDEFIVLEGAKDEMTGRLLAQKIRAELSEVQEKMQLPFQLSASIGAVVAQPGEENVLGSYIKQAEKLMYEEKAEKKVSRDN